MNAFGKGGLLIAAVAFGIYLGVNIAEQGMARDNGYGGADQAQAAGAGQRRTYPQAGGAGIQGSNGWDASARSSAGGLRSSGNGPSQGVYSGSRGTVMQRQDDALRQRSMTDGALPNGVSGPAVPAAGTSSNGGYGYPEGSNPSAGYGSRTYVWEQNGDNGLLDKAAHKTGTLLQIMAEHGVRLVVSVFNKVLD